MSREAFEKWYMENHSQVYDSDHEDWLRTAYDAGRAQAIDECINLLDESGVVYPTAIKALKEQP
jgi:hypothetical protein